MNGRVVRLGGDEHDFVQCLLPWLDGGGLDATESARVQAHLNQCERCRADVAWQRSMRECWQGAASAATLAAEPGEVDRGWAALRGRLEASGTRAGRTNPRTAPVGRRLASLKRAWWQWLLALQSAAIAALVVLVAVLAPPEGNYHALGSTRPASDASIAVVFRPQATELQIRQALRESDTRVVDGPTVTGAYLLGVAPTRHAAAIEALRLHAAVLRVESLLAGPRR